MRPSLFAGSAVFLAAAVLPGPLAADEPKTVHTATGFDIQVIGDLKGFALDVGAHKLADGLEVVSLKLTRSAPQPPPRFTLKWPLPSHDVVGQWATGRQLNKTIRPDWSGGRLQASMFAREAPVSCLFSSDDRNVLTFAVSDALDTVLIWRTG